jgi:hypothetical protein
MTAEESAKRAWSAWMQLLNHSWRSDTHVLPLFRANVVRTLERAEWIREVSSAAFKVGGLEKQHQQSLTQCLVWFVFGKLCSSGGRSRV